jgi:hypothetical protein
MKNKYKIVDNFLPKEQFINIKNILTGEDFEWYYSNGVSNTLHEKSKKEEFQFFHIFYENNFPRTNFEIILPIIDKIKPFSLKRIKANLLTRSEKIITYPFHIDFNKEGLTTGIYYVNTNNGYTVFKDGTKIESIENRYVSFDSNLIHTGTSCTDEKIRVLINFNYYK